MYKIYYSAYDCIVPARGKALVKTDLQIELPTGCYGRVAPRSGLALKNFIDVGGKKYFYLNYNLYLSILICYFTPFFCFYLLQIFIQYSQIPYSQYIFGTKQN